MIIIKKRMRLLTAFMLVLISGFLCSCSTDKIKEKSQGFPYTLETESSGIVATNDRFSLEWDNDQYCVLLTHKDSGKIWSTIPYDFYQTTETNEDMNSPVYIEYVDSKSMISVVSKGFTDSAANKRIASRTIENGIEVTYYFDSVGISVPVQYCLRDDALAVTVDFAHAEEGEHDLLSVSVAPFLCSAQNVSENAYIVVPSGSGALMYLDERAEGTRTWSGEIYGVDPTRLLPESLANDEAVRLPIFGIKDGENALMAIVEAGCEAAVIKATAGNEKTGYSNAYVSFYARGYDILESQQSWTTRDVYRTEETISVDKATVAFYPLSGEDADYMGMASFYQEYLEDAGMAKQETEGQVYALYLTGGAKIKELFLGVPIAKTRALTTFSDAKNILSDLMEETGTAPAVQLRGFGNSGLDKGKLAGGFGFSDKFGSDSERLALEAFCEEKEIPLFTDFDLINFASGGNGYHTLMDAAKSASMRKASLYEKDKALWNYDEDSKAYYMLKREKLQSAVDKLEKLVEKKEVSGISLSTLGQTAYSDYTDEKYSARGNSITDAQNYISQLRKLDKKIATQSANDYAAAMSDAVFEAPMGDGGYTGLDASIPLYQMIFKGYVSMYSTSLNTASDFDREVMLAVQSGTSLGFSVVGEYDMEFATTSHTGLHASSYAGNKTAICKAVLKCADYYSAIQGQTITDYEFVSEYVTKTSFSNGVVVYANHSKQSVETPLGELEAYGFSYTEPGVKE